MGGKSLFMEVINVEIANSVFTVVNVLRVLIVAAISFFVALLITAPWMKILHKYGFFKKKVVRFDVAPIFSKLHQKKQGIPIGGGVIIWGTVLIVIFSFWIFAQLFPGSPLVKLNFLSRSQTLLPLGALIISAVLGLIDDIWSIKGKGDRGRGLRMRDRFVFYALLGFGGAWWFYYKLDWDFINVPFLGDITLGLWYMLFFAFVIVASTFSANETDGLDGLLGGVALTILGAFGVISFVQERMDLVVFIVAIIGALIAFLWNNIYPAKFFMGDTGAMALGTTIGVIALFLNVPLLLPVIGIIFVIESGSVLLQLWSKKFRGKKIFLSSPIHHHFEALGWPEMQVTMRFWMISAIGAILGLIIFLVDSRVPPFFR
ncbi:MAG: phospho-N-acetylmuramoyl-pentapeptide-transferase [Parcubacteria group bacterium RIFCSPLOWO2_02_FULL_40_12]|nr:MAG: phospho-N-acetylmuramoyl-pentapeptide-transferase [Parcubacteria group bacterium RIFCSPLOWO2_02_FULL_40_12]